MLTLRISLAAMVVGRVCFLFLIATVTLDVGCPRLAQAAAVGALRDWAAFLVDVGQRAVYTVPVRAIANAIEIIVDIPL